MTTMKNNGISASVKKDDNINAKNALAKRYGIIIIAMSRKLPRCGRWNIKGNNPKKNTENTM